MPMRVHVEPHNPRWAEDFAVEAERIRRALGPIVAVVHHIGSTAIPGIYAKPIIDFLIEVRDINAVDSRHGEMAALGYEALGEFGLEGRRYFRKDDDAGNRTHHVHTYGIDSPQLARHLAFRDFLRAHPDWAGQYSELKRRLVEQHPDSIESYMDGKDPFIKRVEQLALEWQRKQRAVP